MNMNTEFSAKWLRTTLCLSFGLFSVSFAQAQTTITWTGATDAIYTKPGNWNLGRVPNSTDNVVIPSATTVSTQPVLDATLGIGAAGNLTINSGASLTLNAQSELDLFGNLINNGSFNGQGTLSIRTGTAPHFITSSNGANNAANTIAIRDLELLAGSQTFLSLPVTLQRALTLNADLNVSTNGSLTLLSTPSVTAYVINNGTAIVNGTVTVQRAIDNSVNTGVGYRHYSSPVRGNLVNDFGTSTFLPNFNTAYNESSFAPGTTPFPTVYLYDQARVTTDNGYSARNGFSEFDRGWVVPASGASMLTGRGYTVNLGGSELVDFVGALNNGPYNVTVSRNAVGTSFYDLSGYQMLGNPYPAPIDWSRAAAVSARTAADIADGMYVFTSTSRFGGYYRAYAGGSGNPVIPLGQGFLVRKANPGAATFTFTNDFRLTTSDGTTMQRPVANIRPQLEMALHSSDKVVQDMLNVYFESSATAGVDDKHDAFKLPNKNGMFLGTLTTDGQELAVDGRPMPADKLTIPLHVAVSASGAYTIETTELANMGDLHVYLHDIRLGSYTDLAQQPEYTFNLNSVSSAPRFELVFSKQPITETAPAALTQQVSLYPSPAKGTAFLDLPTTLSNEAIKTTLVDALGRTVRTASLAAEGEATHQIDIQGLRSGIYVLQLHTSAGIVAKRLVVE